MTRANIPSSLWYRRIDSAWLGVPLLLLWRLLDACIPKRLDYWAFFAHPLKPDQLIENARAVYERIHNDPQVECTVFHRGGCAPDELAADGRTRVLELASLAGLWALARCGVLMLTNSTAMDMSLAWRNGRFAAPRVALHRRVVVNLWHGIPLKRLFALANPEQRRHGDRNRSRRRERAHYDGLIASSDIDSHAMAAIFHPIPPSRVWVTGLPRNDFLRMPEAELPRALAGDLQRLRAMCRGRRLLLYAPTYRDASVADTLGYSFNEHEIAQLRQLLHHRGAVLGMRSHYLANGPDAFPAHSHGDEDWLLDVGHQSFPEIAPLLRECQLVVTDYSSVYIDALCIDRPVIAFAHDLDHYRMHQNGLLYDMELAFPGPVTRDFKEFFAAVDLMLSGSCTEFDERYKLTKRMFFAHDDGANSQRVIERTRALIDARRSR
ncbi:Teichoic acid biosynthesis protein B [uncultured Stenotrophomonas sp.]|uniref:Teichoic acid biosynthesis protein B n=1 Tax=uncultured Stenotrophomonas sp. TaxID=165438 RepID=A0A1Y5Q1B8_9GAMM|nr:Teichoic acid biosynthesis protein B [uncultured Stenotrophomonas sp.]